MRRARDTCYVERRVTRGGYGTRVTERHVTEGARS